MTDVVPILGSAGLGGIAGFAAGYAIKKILRIGLVIVGLFCGGLMLLSYRKIVTVNWDQLSNQSQVAAQQVTQQVTTVVNNTAGQFHSHNGTIMVSLDQAGVPIAGGTMFMLMFAAGMQKG